MPGPKRYIICIKPDRLPHPLAQMHIVQNAQDPVTRFKGWGGYFIPQWPQPGLIPREPSRRDRFKNVAYVGNEVTLPSYMKHPAWRKALGRIGLEWHPLIEFWRWHDYSEIDAIVALRSSKLSRDRLNEFHAERRKPPSKLYNAWLAGVPAVLGRETAYRAERRSPLDYIEVDSRRGALAALRRLQSSTDLRKAMARNGRLRAAELKDHLLGRWKDFLVDVAGPAYAQWRSSPLLRGSFELERRRFLADPSKYFY